MLLTEVLKKQNKDISKKDMKELRNVWKKEIQKRPIK